MKVIKMSRILQSWSAQSWSAIMIILVAASSALSHAQSAASCDSLTKLVLPNATITGAQSYAAGEYKLPSRNGGGPGGPGGPAGQGGQGGPGAAAAQQSSPSLPAFCRLSLTLKPSSDSDIKMEVWLPTSGWNGKFVGVGNFGTAGALQYQFMVDPLSQNYALAANDTGHTGGGGGFAIGHPEKFIDYAYRADHEMTLRAKEIVSKFYGKAPSRSIWVGCSLGGVEALIEAKRYPEDYDGIVAGAPPNPFPLFNAMQIWPGWLNLNHPEGSIPASKFTKIHQAALKACGTPVGLAQGFIEDPEHCSFDPGTLQCKGDDAADCLTAPQVERARELYRGPVDPRTGKVIFPGPAIGAENEIASVRPVQPAVDLYQSFVYQDPKWDWKTMDYAASVDKAEKELNGIITVDSDLSAFLNRGGKLMLYVGWTEGHNANDLAKYYKDVVKHTAAGKANNVRLFLVPGMNHCGGGMGCDTFEKVSVVDQWIESKKAPGQILSSKLSGGKTIRTRPLCAYPAVARYKGTGSMDEADSFVCAKPN
jgi:feruloyl esterase